jgi:hypothetical protein
MSDPSDKPEGLDDQSGSSEGRKFRSAFDFSWDSEEDGEFTPYTQSRSPTLVYAKKSSPEKAGGPSEENYGNVGGPSEVSGPAQIAKKRTRGPADCLNWDSDEEVVPAPKSRSKAKTVPGVKNVRKKCVAKNSDKKKRTSSKAKGKSLGKLFCCF